MTTPTCPCNGTHYPSTTVPGQCRWCPCCTTPPAQSPADTPTTPDPHPVPGLHLPLLHYGTQPVLCCNQPMRFNRSDTSWTGKPGNGLTHECTERTCTHCGATLTIASNTPS